MAAAVETQANDDGFTMKFSLDVISNIEQDVEDVARQVTLGNFRKACRMYEEALATHSYKFPVYAEYLRLCIDGDDWESLAMPLVEIMKHQDVLEQNGWSPLKG